MMALQPSPGYAVAFVQLVPINGKQGLSKVRL